MEKTSDLNILNLTRLVSPASLKSKHPIIEKANATVVESRKVIKNILAGKDPRFLAIIGPCSIHDPESAVEYAERLSGLKRDLDKQLYLVMRVYFEKPRTSLGWRGMIIDPYIDGCNNIAEGLTTARKLLLEITGMGIPAATEMLDPIVPQYMDDLLSWAAIGARTTESQTHRNMASGLSMPVGFKNSTEGNLQIAIDAILSAQNPHSFIGIDQEGRTCVLNTRGNRTTHIILRGSRKSVNYKRPDLIRCISMLKNAGFSPTLMVDCSHGNSRKNPDRQAEVLKSVIKNRTGGLKEIIGFMLESNIRRGSQRIPENLSELEYGVSITDKCMGWQETEKLLFETYESLSQCI